MEVYIFTGGKLTDHLLSFINIDEGKIIGVDHGAEWLLKHDIVPDYFIGDFDSVHPSFFEKIKRDYPDKVLSFPPEKDETDTELAINLALSLHPKHITILGGNGTRLDHVIANIQLLLKTERLNISSRMIDSNNRIQLLLPGQSKKIEKSDYPYVSLIPFSDKVDGISIAGFKYPLNQASMQLGIPYGISNELMEPVGTISIKSGILLIIESKD